LAFSGTFSFRDNKLSNKFPWVADEGDEAALRPRLQDIDSGRARRGQATAQIAREHGIHPSLPTRWREEQGIKNLGSRIQSPRTGGGPEAFSVMLPKYRVNTTPEF
jgi:hypothetical protein